MPASFSLLHFRNTAKAPLFGTMRHELFEQSIKKKDFSRKFAEECIRKIVRRNAESIVACGVTSDVAESEVIKVLPQLQDFVARFTKFDPKARSLDQSHNLLEPCNTSIPMNFTAMAVEAVEEPVISAELGLKGNIDVVVQASTTSTDSQGGTEQDAAMMSVELKTGHLQRTQNAHLAQLSLYTLMLQLRYGLKRGCSNSVNGSRPDGVLLYLNNEAIRVFKVTPTLSEMKSLLVRRNVVATETLRASRPRGIILSYQEQESAEDGPK